MIAEVEKKSRSCFHRLLNLIYPLRCLICQEAMEPSPPRGLCPNCFDKIQRNFSVSYPERIDYPIQRDGLSYPNRKGPIPLILKDSPSRPLRKGLKDGSSSWPAGQTKYYFNQVYSACPYQGMIKESIQLLKYKGKLILTKQLSQIMIEFTQANGILSNIDCLTFVPLHRTRLKEREFNQSQLLALKLAGHFKVPLLNNVLKRTRLTPPQTNLSKEERFKSLKGAFAVYQNREIKEKTIMLVDDVFTTGATVNECAKALTEGGAKQVDIFTLARG